MFQSEQLDLFDQSSEEVPAEVSQAVADAEVAVGQPIPPTVTEREYSEATADQGHAGSQLIPGTPLATLQARQESQDNNTRDYSLSGARTVTEAELSAEAMQSEAFAAYRKQREILRVERALKRAANHSGRSLALLEASNKPNKQ